MATTLEIIPNFPEVSDMGCQLLTELSFIDYEITVTLLLAV